MYRRYFVLAGLILVFIRDTDASTIRFGGQDAELVISEVTPHTVRIEWGPSNEQRKGEATVLESFPVIEKLRVRDVSDDKESRIGLLRVSLKAEPLSLIVRRED